MNNVTRMPSAGAGRLATSMRDAGSVMRLLHSGGTAGHRFIGRGVWWMLSHLPLTAADAARISLADHAMTAAPSRARLGGAVHLLNGPRRHNLGTRETGRQGSRR